MIKFGTGGWRAIIGEEFILSNVRLLSQALAMDMLAKGWGPKGLVIGFDRRFLSDRGAKWIAEVMAGNGIPVYFLSDIAPTPLIMYTVKEMHTMYGVAVTASHNPAEYNGIKIFTEGGRDATETVTNEIEKIIGSISEKDIQVMPFEEGMARGIIKPVDPFNDYIDAIIRLIDMDVIRKRGLKILLDPMYGVSKSSLQTILLTARCELDIINDRHDTLFGGRLPSPSAATLAKLKDIVLEKGYDLGIATDGDADRLGIIDDTGRFIHPNDIMVLLYYYLLKYKGWKGGVVRNLATTHLLDRVAAAFGENVYEVPVGFKHISAKMEETDSILGGESSGGLTIRGHIKGKDGIFAASLLVEAICATGKEISGLLNEIHQEYGFMHFEESDFKFSQEAKARMMKTLFEDKKLPDFGYKVKRVNYIDGVKVYFEPDNGLDGWVIARFSGTEPLLRIFAEMPEESQASQVIRAMREFLDLA